MYAENRFLMTSKKKLFLEKRHVSEKNRISNKRIRSLCWFIFVVSHFLGSNLLTRWLHTPPHTHSHTEEGRGGLCAPNMTPDGGPCCGQMRSPTRNPGRPHKTANWTDTTCSEQATVLSLNPVRWCILGQNETERELCLLLVFLYSYCG